MNLELSKIRLIVTGLFLMTLIGSCKLLTNSSSEMMNDVTGFYRGGQMTMELKSDSTFAFGRQLGGVGSSKYVGSYETPGIELKLKIQDHHFVWAGQEDRSGSIEMGYIDYENQIIYAFGYRLKKIE